MKKKVILSILVLQLLLLCAVAFAQEEVTLTDADLSRVQQIIDTSFQKYKQDTDTKLDAIASGVAAQGAPDTATLKAGVDEIRNSLGNIQSSVNSKIDDTNSAVSKINDNLSSISSAAKANTWLLLANLALLVLLLIFSLLDTIKLLRRPKELAPPILERKMQKSESAINRQVVEQVKKYAREAMSRGMDKDSLKQQLANAGWPSAEIEQAFSEL